MSETNGLVFSESITPTALTSVAQVSDTLGPGRIGRCSQAKIWGKFGSTSSQGLLSVEFSAHQDFPDYKVLDTIAWTGASDPFAFPIPPEYLGGFIRVAVRTTAFDGNGVLIYAGGNR